MKNKLSLKILVALVTRTGGLTYKEISLITNYHINTVSRYVSYLDNKGLIDMKQEKSNSIRGRKWVNVVSLKKEFLQTKDIADFFNKVIKQLGGGLNDIFTD
ncbi:MAG: ArsR family transcriptional regulator [Nanoarchaeota archaeon]|nr:ArsR family transcriptional regulator [Nanoarchaeota archaeon]MBU1005103.1 ArsR family transcriptional regulator [Nanoarchaeota archaeon]MBU1945431.1 ArsR family transcriptional regulator [Nanoarchaeota archaeon]